MVGAIAYMDFMLSQYMPLTMPAPTSSTIMTEKTMVYERTVMKGFQAYKTSRMKPKIAEPRKARMIMSIE